MSRWSHVSRWRLDYRSFANGPGWPSKRLASRRGNIQPDPIRFLSALLAQRAVRSAQNADG